MHEACLPQPMSAGHPKGHLLSQHQRHQESRQHGHRGDGDQLNKVISELNGKTLRMSLPRVLASSPVCLLAGPWLFLLPLGSGAPAPGSAPAAVEEKLGKSGDDMGFGFFD